MSYFKQLKTKGTDVERAIEEILEGVENAIIHGGNAETLAEELHSAVKGDLIHASRENSYKFGKQVMKDVILGNYYNKVACKLPSKQIVDAIITALREADLESIADKIVDACKKESDISTPTSPSPAQANRKIITGLSKTPHKIPTSTAVGPSDQGNDPVCASHAVGKGVVGILDDCGFDVVKGQEQFINDIVNQVQPTAQAKNPDEFNKEELNVTIKSKTEGKEYDVKVKIDIQTDMRSSPKPCWVDESELKEKKVKMIIRAQLPQGNHALFVKNYKADSYQCINSWAKQPFLTVPKDDVYALDYIQITEM